MRRTVSGRVRRRRICPFTGAARSRSDRRPTTKKTEPPPDEDGSVNRTSGRRGAGLAHQLAAAQVAQADQAEAHQREGAGFRNGVGHGACREEGGAEIVGT